MAAVLITPGSMALGYTGSVGLAMAGIAIDDQKDIGSAVGLAGCVRNTISTVGTAIYSVGTQTTFIFGVPVVLTLVR